MHCINNAQIDQLTLLDIIFWGRKWIPPHLNYSLWFVLLSARFWWTVCEWRSWSKLRLQFKFSSDFGSAEHALKFFYDAIYRLFWLMKICQKFHTTLSDEDEDWTQHKVFNLLITQTKKKKQNKNIFIRIINAIFMTHLGQAQKGHKKNAAKTERRFRTCVLLSLQRALFAYYDLRGEGQRLRCRWLGFPLLSPLQVGSLNS